MSATPRRRAARAEDDDIYPTFLGIGTVHGISAPEEEPPEPPGIWLPDHRSGSRFGGWHRRPIAQVQPRPIGFRRP